MNAEADVLDRIAELVDEQLASGPRDDYDRPYLARIDGDQIDPDLCAVCHGEWHGIATAHGCPSEFGTEEAIAAFRASLLRPRTRTERREINHRVEIPYESLHRMDPNQSGSYTIADLEAMRAGYSRYRPPRDGAPWMVHDSQISDGARWSTHGSHISEVRVSGTAGDPIHLLPAHRFWSCSPDGHLFTVTGVLLVRSYTNRIGPEGRSVTLDFEVVDAVIDFDITDPEFPQIVGQPPGSVVLEEPGTDGEWAPVAMCGAGNFELEDNRDAIVGFGGDIVAVHVRTYAKMTVSTVSPGSSLYRAIGGCFDW